MEPGAAQRKAELEVGLECCEDPLEGVEVLAVVGDELVGRLRLRLADRGALLEPPGGGVEVEGANVELVDHQRPALFDHLAEPVAGLFERVDVVEGDDRDRRRERGCGLVEVDEGDRADILVIRPRVDCHDVVAARAERAGEAAGARSDLEHARGRLGQVRADEGPQIGGRHPPDSVCQRSVPSYDSTMAVSAFEIEITRQGWIDPDLSEAPGDLCSHGDIRLEIGGQVIVSGQEEHWYTISTSALALLRTLEADHSPQRPVTDNDNLILHCGMLMMLSCPIGIEWSVTHLDDQVRLHDVIRRDSTSETEDVRFPGLAVDLPLGEYRQKIAGFAAKAKEPFLTGAQKAPGDSYDEELYRAFWQEYDERLERAETSL